MSIVAIKRHRQFADYQKRLKTIERELELGLIVSKNPGESQSYLEKALEILLEVAVSLGRNIKEVEYEKENQVGRNRGG